MKTRKSKKLSPGSNMKAPKNKKLSPRLVIVPPDVKMMSTFWISSHREWAAG